MTEVRRWSMRASILFLCLLPLPRPVWAQDAPPLRVTAHAPSRVQANGTLELQLEVMTSTWFTQPPRLPTLTLPGVLVTPPSGEGVLLREQRDGVAYSGVRYTYLLIATQPGKLQIPALTVSAQVGPGRNAVSASSTPLTIAIADNAPVATGAVGATASAPTQPATTRNGTASPQNGLPASSAIVAANVAVTQDYKATPDPLVTGGRITRTVTQRAEGAQAMSLPAAPLDDVPHFKRYPMEPEVTTLTDGRGSFVGGQRIDRAQYVALEAGAFEFPALTLPWRSATDGVLKENTVPGRSVAVGMAPKPDVPFSLADDLARLRQDARWALPSWTLQTAAMAIPALLLIWLTWPWWRRAAGALRAASHRAKARWHASESFYWRAWQGEARRAPTTLGAFYRWLRRCAGRSTLRAAVSPLDAASRSQAEAMLRHLYGPNRGSPGDDRLRLLGATRTWRKAWRRRDTSPGAHALPRTLAAYSSTTVSRQRCGQDDRPNTPAPAAPKIPESTP